MNERPLTLQSMQQAGRTLAQCLRLMVGLPDYGAYLAHCRDRHPGAPVLSYEAFFRRCQEARYSGRGGRCC